MPMKMAIEGSEDDGLWMVDGGGTFQIAGIMCETKV